VRTHFDSSLTAKREITLIVSNIFVQEPKQDHCLNIWGAVLGWFDGSGVHWKGKGVSVGSKPVCAKKNTYRLFTNWIVEFGSNRITPTDHQCLAMVPQNYAVGGSGSFFIMGWLDQHWKSGMSEVCGIWWG